MDEFLPISYHFGPLKASSNLNSWFGLQIPQGVIVSPFECLFKSSWCCWYQSKWKGYNIDDYITFQTILPVVGHTISIWFGLYFHKISVLFTNNPLLGVLISKILVILHKRFILWLDVHLQRAKLVYSRSSNIYCRYL